MIIGNLTRDCELRTTATGLSVCTFTVAVNKKTRDGNQPEADFFRVTAWRQLGENCAKYLAKGRKVCVIGPVSVSTYKAQDGSTRASLEVTADDVEFLSPKSEGDSDLYQTQKKAESAKAAQEAAEERDAIQREARGELVYQAGDNMDDDLPFD